MSQNNKELFAYEFLLLLEKNSLESINIKQLTTKSGLSRQSFYNYFLDKNDLIQFIYEKYIIPDFDENNLNINFRDSLLLSFKNMKKYHRFMKEACMKEDQNCLKDYIFNHCETFDLQWHQKLYGKKTMPKELVFATKYHANASSSMTLSWIISDMPIPPAELATRITEMRGMGMEKMFEKAETKGDPYKFSR
ncbi:TetR/AcrR family transcriptional regulator [Lacticigenium naphthae]|uniref:TetR/AcrR family transcriptional regulator n=1 Tax=Lacticigenium naphthae TaxID=515351 RepID=UPI000403050E|nr:TetR/AcrR family transcriptional regulator [Lacticigenium naphthae]